MVKLSGFKVTNLSVSRSYIVTVRNRFCYVKKENNSTLKSYVSVPMSLFVKKRILNVLIIYRLTAIFLEVITEDQNESKSRYVSQHSPKYGATIAQVIESPTEKERWNIQGRFEGTDGGSTVNRNRELGTM